MSQSEDLNLNAVYTEHGLTHYHYITEIIRYWNQLNFISNKTLRSLPKGNTLGQMKKETLIYLTYRYFWEKAQFPVILSEIDEDQGLHREFLFSFYTKLTSFNWDIALQNKSKTEILSIKYAIPSFTVNTLRSVMDYENIAENIQAMDERARKGLLYLRINNLIYPTTPISELRSDLVVEFKNIGVKASPDEDFPEILKVQVQDKSKIVKSSFYKQKLVLFHDKASYSAVSLLDPQSNDKICDLCAAPGIKTSLISHRTRNNVFITAGDFHFNRLHEMVSVLKSYGVKNVHSVQWDGIQPPLKKNFFDKILLDAPCTGSGTFTSNPVLKWKQNKRFLNRHIFLQESLLKSALDLLKVGGSIIYSTCSLYPEEGEYQIDKLSEEKVEFEDTPAWLPSPYMKKSSVVKGSGRFSPAIDHTIGFFISKIIKKK